VAGSAENCQATALSFERSVLIYHAVAFAERFTFLDHDVSQRQVAAVIKDAAAGAVCSLGRGIGACTGGAVVCGLTVLNREILKRHGDIRARDVKHTIANGTRIQTAGVDEGCVWAGRLATHDRYRVQGRSEVEVTSCRGIL